MKKTNSFEMLHNFLEDRPVMEGANQDVDFLLSLLVQEVAEALEEPHGMSPELYLIQEISDVAIFAITILDLLTGNADMAIRSKICRNVLKYPAHLFQEGTYEESVAESKAQWSAEDNEDFYKE